MMVTFRAIVKRASIPPRGNQLSSPWCSDTYDRGTAVFKLIRITSTTLGFWKLKSKNLGLIVSQEVINKCEGFH